MGMQKSKLKSWISFRVRPNEYDIIHGHFQKTTCRKLSEYARKVLLNKPVIVKFRNQSADEFLREMIKLKNELSAVGNNFNQSVKRLHTLEKIPEVKTWLSITEPSISSLMINIEEIKNRMNQVYELWSQK
jgi:FAD synthase